MQKSAHILICDDQPIIHESLGVYLESEGFTHASAFNGVQAVKMAETESPDLILMDLMMPDKNGMDACREIRQKSSVPIIMLTAKGEEVDRIVGFELGADDYVVKPFSPRELLLRAKTVLNPTAGRSEDMPQKLQGHSITLDLDTHECICAGQKLSLTITEFKLLTEMLRRPGKALSREHLLDAVWGYSFEGYARTVDTHMRRLRHKLGEAAACIETVRGVGYRIKQD